MKTLVNKWKAIMIAGCFIMAGELRGAEILGTTETMENFSFVTMDFDKPFRKRNQNSNYLYRPGLSFSRGNDRQVYNAFKKRGKGTPQFAVKTNVLSLMTSSLNLGAEVRLTRKTTFQASASWNPWTYNEEANTKFKHLLVEPEVRVWTCEAFNGHFFGVHGHYAYYNVGALPVVPFSENLNQHRFEGQLAGAGVSYGYHWLLGTRWSVDAEIGAGYARLWYDRYPCQTCAKAIGSETRNYWGITRLGVSLVYLF